VNERPDGLLLHERIVFSEEPLHVGMRQYWRDLEALEAWTRELPHKRWWTDYLRDRGGTSFWHETYFRRGGIESVYVDVATRSA
jgi:Monooxygenase af470-like